MTCRESRSAVYLILRTVILPLSCCRRSNHLIEFVPLRYGIYPRRRPTPPNSVAFLLRITPSHNQLPSFIAQRSSFSHLHQSLSFLQTQPSFAQHGTSQSTHHLLPSFPYPHRKTSINLSHLHALPPPSARRINPSNSQKSPK